jgi:hypothetical protein
MASLVIADLQAAAAHRSSHEQAVAAAARGLHMADEVASLEERTSAARTQTPGRRSVSGFGSPPTTSLDGNRYFAGGPDREGSYGDESRLGVTSAAGSSGAAAAAAGMQGSADAGFEPPQASGAGALPARHYVLFGAVSTSTIAVLLLFTVGCVSYMALENLPIIDAMYLTTGAFMSNCKRRLTVAESTGLALCMCDSVKPMAGATLQMRSC